MRFYSVYSALFLICLFAYSQWVPNDLTSKLLLALALVYISGCFSLKTVNSSVPHYDNLMYLIYQFLLFLILVVDLSLKMYLVKSNNTSFDWLIDLRVPNQMLSIKL